MCVFSKYICVFIDKPNGLYFTFAVENGQVKQKYCELYLYKLVYGLFTSNIHSGAFYYYN